MNKAVILLSQKADPAVVDGHLQEILWRRFKRAFVSDHVPSSSDQEPSSWHIRLAQPPGDRFPADETCTLDLWLEGNKILLRRPSTKDFATWLQTVVQEELAAKLDGLCADESLPFQIEWKPDPGKFRTLRSWWEYMIGGSVPVPEDDWSLLVRDLPPAVGPFVGGPRLLPDSLLMKLSACM